VPIDLVASFFSLALPSSERSTTQASASLAIILPSAAPISAVIGTSACFPPNTTTG